MCKGEHRFTDELKDEYLRLLAETGAIGKCAQVINISPATIKVHRKQDPEFQDAFDMALELFRDKIDLAVYHRGLSGWVEDVWYQGEVVGTKRVYSDALLALLAKRHNPLYRDRVEIEANVTATALVVTAPVQTVADMMAEAARIAQEGEHASTD